MDKPDVAALIARLLDPNHSRVYGAAGAAMLRQAAAALQSQQARIAELESALRYIQVRTGTDVAMQWHIATALKGSGK